MKPITTYLATAALAIVISASHIMVVEARGTDKPDNLTAASNDSLKRWGAENIYWNDKYASRPYSKKRPYALYEPAYRYGVELYERYGSRPYSALSEAKLRKGWERKYESSTLTWEEAEAATRDAYERLYANGRNSM